MMLAVTVAVAVAVASHTTTTTTTSSDEVVCARIKNNQYSTVFEIPGVMSSSMCDDFVRRAEIHATVVGGWETTRHDDYPTTDFDTADIPDLRIPTETLVRTTIAPAMARAFDLDPARLEISEVFLAKYAAKKGTQRRLRAHTDESEFSFVVALNDGYDGGGTRFTRSGIHARAAKGDGIMFCGKLRHEGMAVTRGVRYILAGFMKYGAGCDSSDSSDSDSEDSDSEFGSLE